MNPERERDVCIVGGAGHVGLPLALLFADTGLSVSIYDVNEPALKSIRRGEMPFLEYGAEPLLETALKSGRLTLSSDVSSVESARHVIVTVGTPVDEYLNPKLRALLDLFNALRPHLSPEQTIIIRSTVFPGTCRHVVRTLGLDGHEWRVAYCPERIAQGHAVDELRTLPQIVAGCSPDAVDAADALFSRIAPRIVRLAMEEAELAKLFSNAWRYIQFAAANQFYMFAESTGVDFNRVREAMVAGYGRASSLPSAGFAAGPCLLKDTMQLAAFNANNFTLGQAAMTVNEGLPNFLVERLRHRYDIDRITVGILGMAYKADIDDSRDSLSYKLGKVLRFHGAQVLYSDEFVQDPTFVSKEELLARSRVVILGVPHTAYRDMTIPAHVDLVDVWGYLQRQEAAAGVADVSRPATRGDGAVFSAT